ncbi:MAG: FAD:protein FMN transferase, partial [Acidobacteria bacterium]|nr:FAD:protein FMN transferase [Acidobacteriota bacterium]
MPEPIEYRRSCEAMGTRFEVILRGADEQHLEAVAVAVCEEIQRLDAALSRFNPTSEITRLNRLASAQAVRVDRELFALLVRCEQARELTEGYFDVTALSGGNGLMLDAERQTVRFTRPQTAIDLGGVGKGYALDCGRGILERFGILTGLLQGGTSSVLALGTDEWPIDIRYPLQSEAAPIARVRLANCGFSCSAIRHPMQTHSDLVNPLSSEALRGDDACVVMAANAMAAEIFSTALLAMGKAKALRYLAQHTDLKLTV